MFVDLSSSYNTGLYVVAIECFLFFAVITQTKVEEATSLDVGARAFALFFLFQCLALLFWAFSNESYPGAFSYYSANLSAVFGILCMIALNFANASVAVFDRRKQALYRFMLIVNFSITAVCIALVDLEYNQETFNRVILGAALGTLIATAIGCLIRCFQPNKGRNGALIALLGSLAFLATCVAWLYLNNVCIGQDEHNILPSCPLSRKFDHNFLWSIILMLTNVLGAEGALRIMAANHEYEDYTEIP
eukprot:jgi/Galph1/1028/GphlegSOOS_G5794.1